MNVADFGVTEEAYREQLVSSYQRVVEIGRMINSGLTALVDNATMIEYHLARHRCFISIERLPEYEGEKRREILRIHQDLVATMDFPDGVQVEDNESLARVELASAMKYGRELELAAA